MIILTIRTDKPDAEIGLYRDGVQLSYDVWTAHRQLAETLHQRIKDQLIRQKLEPADLDGIIVYEGPGSFTGLRIGISVAQALGYSLVIPVVATGSDEWISLGHERLTNGINSDTPVLPVYGADPTITTPKK